MPQSGLFDGQSKRDNSYSEGQLCRRMRDIAQAKALLLPMTLATAMAFGSACQNRPSASKASEPLASVDGTILKDGRPVGGLLVELRKGTRTKLYDAQQRYVGEEFATSPIGPSTNTDEAGKFAFDSLESGEYILQFQFPIPADTRCWLSTPGFEVRSTSGGLMKVCSSIPLDIPLFMGRIDVNLSCVTTVFDDYLDEYVALSQMGKGAYPHSLHGKVVIVYHNFDSSGIDDLYYDLPDKLRARTPDEVATVVLIERGKAAAGFYGREGETVGTYPALQSHCRVEIVDWKTKELVEGREFWGKSPPVTIDNPFAQSPMGCDEEEILDYVLEVLFR